MLDRDEVMRRLSRRDCLQPVRDFETIEDLDLRGRTLESPLNLTRKRVMGTLDLTGATLQGGLIAEDAQFEKPVILHRCKIFGDVFAKGARFAANVDLSWSVCKGRLYFWRARFGGETNFFQLQCGPADRSRESFVHPGEFNCSWAWFLRPANFGRCHMNGPVYFWRTRFFDRCSFEEASFGTDAVFMGARSEICLDSEELPAGFFERLDGVHLLRPDPEEIVEFEGRACSRYAQLNGVASEQQLEERIKECDLLSDDANILRREYDDHSGPMFGAQAILSRMRVVQPKTLKFIGVNANEWALEGTDVNAIQFFDAAQRAIPASIGLGRSYYSVFISYGGPDAAQAQRLDRALSQAGAETYFFPEDAIPGNRIEAEMRDGVDKHDRTLLVCSRSAVGRLGWLFEALYARDLEERDGCDRLIPITLDDGLWEWQAENPDHQELKRALLDRAAADFRGTIDNENAFNEALAKLLKSLIRFNSPN